MCTAPYNTLLAVVLNVNLFLGKDGCWADKFMIQYRSRAGPRPVAIGIKPVTPTSLETTKYYSRSTNHLQAAIDWELQYVQAPLPKNTEYSESTFLEITQNYTKLQ